MKNLIENKISKQQIRLVFIIILITYSVSYVSSYFFMSHRVARRFIADHKGTAEVVGKVRFIYLNPVGLFKVSSSNLNSSARYKLIVYGDKGSGVAYISLVSENSNEWKVNKAVIINDAYDAAILE